MRSLVKLAIGGAFVVSNGVSAGYGLYKNYKQKKEFAEKEKEFKKREEELRNDNKTQADMIKDLQKQVEEYKLELEKGDVLNVYNKLQENDYSYFETFNTVNKALTLNIKTNVKNIVLQIYINKNTKEVKTNNLGYKVYPESLYSNRDEDDYSYTAFESYFSDVRELGYKEHLAIVSFRLGEKLMNLDKLKCGRG